MPKIHLKKSSFEVKKTGLPFYDAARLIGAAHLFYGTASAEIEDRGAYWRIEGIDVKRDEEQIKWILEEIRPTQKERSLFQKKKGGFPWEELYSYFLGTNKRIRKDELKAECDAALQIGTRGVDPLSDYKILAPRSTEVRKKKFFAPFPEKAAITLGRCFAATVISGTKRQREEIYIIPIFTYHAVISGFLNYNRRYRHSAGGHVASVLAALSILVDLISKKIPVADFAYTKEVKAGNQPIFSESGYLGFEKLCSLWWNAIEEDREETLNILRQIKSFLKETSGQNIDLQNQSLARYLANFIVMLDVESLCMIQKLKSRVISSQQNLRHVLNLFNAQEDIGEVRKIMGVEVELPQNLVNCIATLFSSDRKGWMNKLIRLENTSNIEQFVTELERIISRGIYVTQAQGISLGIEHIRREELENLLRLQDNRQFRAFKALFLLGVLSSIKVKGGE
ncbi:MAG: hypothetical protein QW279_09170 [Candidatus Jordarchaeaceae archaeon]